MLILEIVNDESYTGNWVVYPDDKSKSKFLINCIRVHNHEIKCTGSEYIQHFTVNGGQIHKIQDTKPYGKYITNKPSIAIKWFKPFRIAFVPSDTWKRPG